MAESYISELGDSLSHGVANTNGDRVKIIAPKLYNDGNGNHPSIATALSGKAASNHTHGNIANGGTLTDTAAAAAGNDYVVIRDADNAKIQTSTIKGTDVADAVSKKHSHSTLTLSTTAQAYDGSHTLALPSTDPYTSARTPASHTHGNIQNGGTLQTNDITIANGDKLVVTDASDSNKVARASLTFDGATTNQMLSKKGEWGDTIAKARAVVDYGATSKAIEIGWSGAAITSPTYFAVYTDSANGYNKAIKDCSLENAKKAINGTSVGSTAVPVFINADGETQVCTDDFVHDGDVTSTYSSTGTAPVNGTAVASALGSKLNVDGSNATNEGVTAMMRKVPSGTGSLSDESNYFGDSDSDHAKIVRRPVLDIWNYVKDKLGSAGSKDRPVYFDGGVPKECDTVLPCSIIDSGSETGYGVFVGGNSVVGSYTRCYCAFLLTATADPDLVAHTYIGTFTFRHGSVLNYELKCLTGTPKYPMRIAVSYNKNSDSTYALGVYVIPADPTVNTYANYKLTRIASAAFTWACTAINAAECAALDNDGAKPALVPQRLFFGGGGSNVTTTGGSWLPTFNKGTINKCRGIVDLSVQVDLSVINQTTYVKDLATYTITLVNSAGTDILPESWHQKGIMPRQTKSSTSGGTVDISHTHRFVFPITSSSNLFAGYRPKITLPSNYPLDSNAKVSVSAICSGIVHPYYGQDTSF